jgi:RimJ/RimL family protein N-acetyltransferase
MVGRVALRPVDEKCLAELLALAIGDAVPEEVMPPVPGPPGWTEERQEAFRAWHRARRAGLEGPLGERTFAIVHEARVVGSARLARRECDVLETGMWLGRSERHRGIGTAALRLLLDEAARLGASSVIADTTTDNAAALTALRRNGAMLTRPRDTVDVRAEMRL